jgi:hypothetical protein
MKMGTIALPWRYDVAAASAIRSDNQRRTAIFRYASWAAVFPVSPVVILRLRPFSINPGTARWALDAYSITSSVVTSSDGGMVNPRALAALRLITCLKRVGCSTGRSAGFAPRNILST